MSKREKIQSTVIKLEYRREFFDLDLMKTGTKQVITVTEDGTIICKRYKSGIRKVQSVEKKNCSPSAFTELCKAITLCIEQADRLIGYVDDSCAELKIFHQYGRVQTMDRGLGNDETCIGDIMNRFLDRYLPDRD